MRPAAETQVRSGHPWVFAESIRDQNREGEAGELVVIFDRKDAFLAVGLYDPASPIRVRVIHRGKPANIDGDWWRATLRAALQKRAGLFDTGTNGGRWINGESDMFPGLVLDRYAETLVVKLYSAIWFHRIAEIVSLVREELAPANLVLRLSRNIMEAARRLALEEGSALVGAVPGEPVQFLESGLTFEADVVRGQKTGFFLDQRENRRRVETLARGKRVLNAFSFSGGFSLYAARGGAKSVTDVDISEHALKSSLRNFSLNTDAVAQCEHTFVQADVFRWLLESGRKQYDLVILDPPSLAKRQADKPAGLKAYAVLAEAGFALTTTPGVTICCSCSAHICAEEFFETVSSASARTGRKFQIPKKTREPLDHLATFAEAEYLKAIYFESE